MNPDFDFLDGAESALLAEVLARRSPPLSERVRQVTTVSRSDAEEIVSVLGGELVNSLDEDWEPTAYGLRVSAVLARFNVVRIETWP